MRFKDLPAIIKIGKYLFRSQMPYFPVVASFDVTNRCTLRCKHCYWWFQEHPTELHEDIFYDKVREIKTIHPTLVAAIWMGGEPLLRKDLVGKCKSLFSFNEVITNGTLPLPFWKDVRFACSVDGTKEYHEIQRGKDTYERIKKNINRSDLKVHIICVLTRLNQVCLEDFVEEWRQTHIKNIGFGFYTPIEGKEDNDQIWLNFQERDRVIDRILKLKKKYPHFINSSPTALAIFKSDKCQQATERCRRDYATFNSICFDSMMRRKFPCVIGKEAICEKCGCGGAVLGEAIKRSDRSFIFEHINTQIYLLKERFSS